MSGTLRYAAIVVMMFCWTSQAADPNEILPEQAGNVETVGMEGAAAVITVVNGAHVQYTLNGQDWLPAAVGTELTKDAVVRTGFGSSCELNFGETSAFQLTPLSSLKIADYVSGEDKEKVQARLQYGAVRCGVEKGRIQADTQIVTPVSTMSIRGTRVVVEYDPGTRRCTFRVDQDGPAIVRRDWNIPPDGHETMFQRAYELVEGSQTDEALNPSLVLMMYDRASWGPGNANYGDISQIEQAVLVYQQTGVVDPTLGALLFNSMIFPSMPDLDPDHNGGGDCPVCPWPD